MDDDEAEERIHGALRELLGVTGANGEQVPLKIMESAAVTLRKRSSSHDSFSLPDTDQVAHHCDKLAIDEQLSYEIKASNNDFTYFTTRAAYKVKR
jgi:hypothetical protein